ncbi:MAG: TIGR02147 family protein [Fibrobacter sp.]|nr:TIGR02147 family protein [Fibrobacter sp.]
MISIFEYTDYRKFLLDYQEEQKKSNPAFSHRYFAQKAGFSSSGLFSNIITGRRNLTHSLIKSFSKAMKLHKKEGDYFEAMVLFNQAKSLEDKNLYYQRMLQLLPVKTEVINRERHEFYSHWWYSAIRELLYFDPFKDDYVSLAKKLDPPIRPDQAKKAIVTLESLGIIKKDSNGFYRQTSQMLTTGKDFVHSLQVANFQSETISLSLRSLEQHQKDCRNISTLTLTVSPESLQQINKEIESVQNRILKIVESDESVNSVYQINFQIFPLTKPDGDEL